MRTNVYHWLDKLTRIWATQSHGDTDRLPLVDLLDSATSDQDDTHAVIDWEQFGTLLLGDLRERFPGHYDHIPDSPAKVKGPLR